MTTFDVYGKVLESYNLTTSVETPPPVPNIFLRVKDLCTAEKVGLPFAVMSVAGFRVVVLETEVLQRSWLNF